MANLLAAALAPFGWDAAATGFRLWTPSTAPRLTLTRCPGGGFALAMGRHELVISPREYRAGK